MPNKNQTNRRSKGHDAPDIFDILRSLEYELSDKRGFFGKKVDLDKCWSLVVQLKNIMPDCLQQAKDIVDNRDKLLRNADTIAKSIITEAEARVASMLDIVEEAKKAQDEGRQIVDKAHQHSKQIVNSTKLHLDKVFEQTEEYIASLAQNISQSRQELQDSNFGGGS